VRLTIIPREILGINQLVAYFEMNPMSDILEIPTHPTSETSSRFILTSATRLLPHFEKKEPAMKSWVNYFAKSQNLNLRIK